MMKTKSVKVAGAIALPIVLLLLTLVVGWGMNVIALFGESFSPLTAMAVGRVIGVFVPPIGGILGWF